MSYEVLYGEEGASGPLEVAAQKVGRGGVQPDAYFGGFAVSFALLGLGDRSAWSLAR